MVGDPILVQVVFDDSRIEPSGPIELDGQIRIEIANQTVVPQDRAGPFFSDGVNAISFSRFLYGTDTCPICGAANQVLERSDELQVLDVNVTEPPAILRMRGEFSQVAISPD